MKRRGLTKQQKRQRALWLAVALIGGSFALVAALIGVRLSLPAPVLLDEATLCPVDGKPRGHTVVVIDKTDFYSAQHVAAIKDWIARKKTGIGEQELLSVRLLTDRPEDVGQSVFQRCNPGDGKDLKRWWANPRKAHARWQASFGDPLEEALGPILSNQETKTSPILEALDVLMWDTAFGPDMPSRTLAIVSDMVQNMPDHNHYRSIPDVDAFLKTPLGRRLKSRAWQGVKVEIVYLRNVAFNAKQGGAHVAFWEKLFRKLGVADVKIIPPFELERGIVAARPAKQGTPRP